MVIYKITNKLDGKTYIGQTKNTIEHRLKQHLKLKGKTYISDALHKHGLDNFTIEVIQTCSSITELNEAEIYHIKQFNSLAPNGYNLTIGGNRPPPPKPKHTDAMRQKMSISQKARFNDPKYAELMRNVTKNVKAVRCIETGIIYPSIVKAAKAIGCHDVSLRKALGLKKRYKKIHGLTFEYVEQS